MDLREEFKKETESTGYFINPDKEFVEGLLKNIEVNKERYGYGACPCRLASGDKDKDLDLICPCDYRDIDLDEYGSCLKDINEPKVYTAGENGVVYLYMYNWDESNIITMDTNIQTGYALDSNLDIFDDNNSDNFKIVI